MTEWPKHTLETHGKPWALNKARIIQNIRGPEISLRESELKDFYEAIASGDGSDTYLGDGVWVILPFLTEVKSNGLGY